MSPDILEGLKNLVGEKNLPKTAKELDFLAAIVDDAVKRNGTDWVKRNPEALLRQWEYCASLL